MLLLSICPHACGCERMGWSVFGGVLSKSRTSLLIGRIGLLAYVRYTYRMAQQRSRTPEADEWDSFMSWLDTLTPLKAGVQPGATDLDERGPKKAKAGPVAAGAEAAQAMELGSDSSDGGGYSDEGADEQEGLGQEQGA